MKNVHLFSRIVFAFFVGLLLTNGYAEELVPPDSLSQNQPGTFFTAKPNEFLNLTINTDALVIISPIAIGTGIISMHIRGLGDVTSTQMTLGNLAPSTVYYLYQDQYKNVTVFTADPSGRYTFAQDLSIPHRFVNNS